MITRGVRAILWVALLVISVTLGVNEVNSESAVLPGKEETLRQSEAWAVTGGSAVFSFRLNSMEKAGLSLGYGEFDSAINSEKRWIRELPISPLSGMKFTVENGNIVEFHEGEILPVGEINISSSENEVTLNDFLVFPLGDEPLSAMWMAEPASLSVGGIELHRIKTGFDPLSKTLTIRSAELRLSHSLADFLGDPELAHIRIGTLTIRALADWVGGAAPEPPVAKVSPELPVPLPREGPDMTFCQLYGFDMPSGSRETDIVGLTEATTSWNVGTADLMWFGGPDNEHPFIVMNFFRLKDDRFEQIGQSHIKHGFFALGNTQCGGTCTYEPGHSSGDWLGQGCTDTYGASLNASQGGMGPRYEVNPWTGEFEYTGSHYSSSHSHDNVQHRLQVHDDDLDPAQNVGATYFAEGYYVVLDDVDVSNNAAYKPVTVSGSPGGNWSFGMTGSGDFPNTGFALYAWTGADRVTLAEEIPVEEFVSPDGRCILSAKATDLGGGTYRYEYALYNVDMDRQVGSFSIPVGSGTLVTNVGFHAVPHHDEPVNTVEPDGVAIDNAAWTSQVSADSVSWTTTSNPLRWGTLYNFRFDAVAPPVDTTVTLGLFRPGTPTEVTGTITGPDPGPQDCNGNGIPDHCDIDCGDPGSECDVLGCGTSLDCNGNGVPDECEADCNGNGIPDDCDIVSGTSQDCDANGVPDECDPDSDSDGVNDGCDICPGFDDNVDSDGDGVPDGCDICPGFDDTLDTDGDGFPDDCDNCPANFNPTQGDADTDGLGDACDPDFCTSAPENQHFDTDPGWTVVNDGANDGQWEWGDPVGGGDREDPADDYDGGGACLLTDNVDGNSDVDGGTTRVLSPIYDLSPGAATLSYAYWFGTNSSGSGDSLVVEVSNDGGSNWTGVATYVNDSNVWQTHVVLLDSILPMTSTVQLRFSATDAGSGSIVEAGIDAVEITIDCFSDCNTNGVHDSCDVDCGAPDCSSPCETSLDCNGNGLPDECDISIGGVSNDCNTNGVPDECDIGSGFSLDCNSNGVPDECEPDCNENGIPDSCDITLGSSLDCNSNGIPDECDIELGSSQDCDGGPLGDISSGSALYSANACFTCHAADGSGSGGPNIQGYSRVQIWDRLLAPTDHTGGVFNLTQQEFADLEAFLSNGLSRGRPDLIPDECQALMDCDGDGISNGCELESGTQNDKNYDGIPDPCQFNPHITELSIDFRHFPSVIPPGDFIEVKNCSERPIELGTLTNGYLAGGKEGNLSGIVIDPGEILVLIPGDSHEFLREWGNRAAGKTVTVSSWPDFANGDGSAALIDADGVVIARKTVPTRERSEKQELSGGDPWTSLGGRVGSPGQASDCVTSVVR